MSSENHPTPILNKVNIPVETSPDRSQKNQKKVPKKIHKAEREKMKREHLNELFIALANALDVSEQTNGKACVLTEAARFVKDMGNQIECLRRDNAALLSESNYVATENKELQDENTALEAQIAKLRNELKERVADTEIDLNQAPPECQQHELVPEQMDGCFRYPVTGAAFQQAQNVNTLYVIPICSNPGTRMDSHMALDASVPASTISKPHPRYPNPGDIWPSQLLEKNP